MRDLVKKPASTRSIRRQGLRALRRRMTLLPHRSSHRQKQSRHTRHHESPENFTQQAISLLRGTLRNRRRLVFHKQAEANRPNPGWLYPLAGIFLRIQQNDSCPRSTRLKIVITQAPGITVTCLVATVVTLVKGIRSARGPTICSYPAERNAAITVIVTGIVSFAVTIGKKLSVDSSHRRQEPGPSAVRPTPDWQTRQRYHRPKDSRRTSSALAKESFFSWSEKLSRNVASSLATAWPYPLEGIFVHLLRC